MSWGRIYVNPVKKVERGIMSTLQKHERLCPPCIYKGDSVQGDLSIYPSFILLNAENFQQTCMH